MSSDYLNHHHLYVFWTLAKQGSFTGAALKLSIAQSAVTAQIKSLEENLGFSLVDRTNKRKPVLTKQGTEVFNYADSIFETSAELLRWAKHGEYSKEQVIRVGALSGLSRNLQYEFLRPLQRNTSVKIQIVTGDQERLVKLLKEHSLDLILSSHNVHLEGRVAFYSHVLTSSPLVFVIKKDAKLGRHATLKDYFKEKELYMPGSNFEARAELEAFLERQNIKPRIAGEIDDIALLRLFGIRSGALTVIPEMGVKNDLLSKDLFVVSKADKIEQRFYAITREKKLKKNILEELVDEFRSSFR